MFPVGFKREKSVSLPGTQLLLTKKTRKCEGGKRRNREILEGPAPEASRAGRPDKGGESCSADKVPCEGVPPTM